jgi:hypothetical protein
MTKEGCWVRLTRRLWPRPTMAAKTERGLRVSQPDAERGAGVRPFQAFDATQKKAFTVQAVRGETLGETPALNSA